MTVKVRYRQESKDRGLMVLESAPQTRTLFTYQGPVSLAFPFLIHTITYGIKGGTYTYYGVYDKGLCVFLSNERLKTMDSMLCYSPTDMERSGLVCTNHSYDRRPHHTSLELVNTVLAVWWGMTHQIPNDWMATWKRLTPRTACKTEWKNAMTLRAMFEWDATGTQFGRAYEGYSAGVPHLTIPKDAKLIDEDLTDVATISDLD